jgi:Na+/phosphate symporter
MKKLFILIVGMFLCAAFAYGQDAYLELLRSDIRAEKVAIITEVMQLNEEEADLFWPIYRKYEVKLSKHFDERIELIRDYAQNYERMTDVKAKELARKVFSLEARRTRLKKKYYGRLERALSSTVAAQFFQLENQILLLIDLQIASELPLIQ